MKRFILLFVMAFFTIMAISSCCLNTVSPYSSSDAVSPSEPHGKNVNIRTKLLESRGKRPYVNPWGKELNFLTDKDGVVWEIDEPVKFAIKFEWTGNPKDFPFEETEFTNEQDDGTFAQSVASGPFKKGYNPFDPGNPDDKERFYKYTLELDGYVMDPVVIVFR